VNRPDQHGGPPIPVSGVRNRTWLPVEFLLFLLHPIRTLIDPVLQLRDPGIGWHLMTGRLIIDTGQIPIADVFSFTATGTEWVSFYWLFQVLAASLEAIGGLPLFTAATVLVYSMIPVLLYRRMVRMGVGSLLAVLLAVLAHIVLLSHSLARPHVVTYVFFALLVERLECFQNGEATAKSLWWLPLLALLWCNFHGGFVIGLVLTAIYALVATARFGWTRSTEEWGRAKVFTALLLGMSAATLFNPAGPWLHLSILDYLGMESTSQFGEWASFAFGNNLRALLVESIVVSFILLLTTGARLAWIEAVLLIFFMHQALQANRHVNLFVIVAVPIVAREAVRAAERARPALGRVLRKVAEPAAPRSVRLLLYGSFCAGFLALAGLGQLSYRSEFVGIHLSADAAAYIETHPQHFSRPFNSDDLGGVLIYRYWPEVRVFMDDRTPVYGDRFILDQYMKVLRAKRGWSDVLDQWEIRTAVVSSRSPAATVLELSSDWEMAHRDDLTAIFLRVGEPPADADFTRGNENSYRLESSLVSHP
jgi:hypothetical protein